MEERRRLRVSKHFLNTSRSGLGAMITAALVLQVSAGVGMAYVAGFSKVHQTLDMVNWAWILAVVGALAVSLLGYYFATKGIYYVDDGPTLEPPHMRSVVLAGFGGFLAHGGSALDKYAMRAGGEEEPGADIRVTGLAGLEHGVLGLIGTAAGIAVLVMGLSAPPLDFSLPWAVIPVPGFALAFWLAGRYETRLREAEGWRHRLWLFMRSILMIRRLFGRDFLRHPAVPGMALFWVAEMFAVWAGMAAFGFEMNWAQLVLGVGTGMLFTRRTGPIAGAGILTVSLSAAIWYSGAPFAAAVTGVFAYRVLSLWLPMPLALAQLPTLRAMGKERQEDAPERVAAPNEPALP